MTCGAATRNASLTKTKLILVPLWRPSDWENGIPTQLTRMRLVQGEGSCSANNGCDVWY